MADESREWSEVQDGEGHGLEKQQPVRYASQQGTKINHGVVDSVSGDTVTILSDKTASRITFRGFERSLLASDEGQVSRVRSELSSNFPFLESIFGSIRAKSFCVRSHLSSIVLGGDGRLKEEWTSAPLQSRAVDGTIRDLLRPTKPANPNIGRTMVVSDRGGRASLHLVEGALLIFDSDRSWQRWARSDGGYKRVVILDRSAQTFESMVEYVQSELLGEYQPFVNIPPPPHGVEAYAYSRTSRGRF